MCDGFGGSDDGASDSGADDRCGAGGNGTSISRRMSLRINIYAYMLVCGAKHDD